MKYRRWVLLIILIVVALLVNNYYLYRCKTIQYSLVFTYKAWSPWGKWDVITDQGFSPIKSFIDEYEKNTGNPAPEFFSEPGQTYVVCKGHTLEKLYYQEAYMSGRWTAKYPFYYAKVELRPVNSGLVYVYKVDDPVRVERDHHDDGSYDTKILE